MNERVFTSLESQRLRLRRFAEADLPPFLAYLNDPLVARYQTWESYTEERARDVIEKQQNLVPGVPGQWFIFAVELKARGLLIGSVCFNAEGVAQFQPRVAATLGSRIVKNQKR